MAVTQIKNDQIQNLSITNAKISASAGIVYSKLSLTDSIVNADINSSAAIAYSKLNLTGSIVNADIDAGAAIDLSKLAEAVIQADGGQAFTANQSMGGNKLTNVGTPTASTDAATKGYVDGLTLGLAWKDYVRATDTGSNVAIATELENGDTLDGVTLATGDRVLLRNQTAPEENGIYVVAASGAASRAADADEWDELVSAAVFVSEGTANADKAYVCTSDEGGTLETTALTFVQFSSATATSADAVTYDNSGNVVITTSNVQAALGELDTAIGNRTYSENNVIADSETLTASLEKLDLAWGDLFDTTLTTEGVSVVGDNAGRYSNFTPAGNTLKDTLTAIDTALGSSLNATYVEEERSGSTSGTWVLSNTPDTGLGHLHVYLNGMKLYPGASNDFTISGDTITFNVTIDTADRVVANYAY